MAATILVVEHQKEERDDIVRRLRTHGFGDEIVVAEDSKGAIHAARQHPPKLVLCAVEPPSRGIEVLHKLRSNALFDETRIVAVTWFGTPNDVDHLIGLGFSGVIRKPLAGDFIAKLTNFLPK